MSSITVSSAPSISILRKSIFLFMNVRNEINFAVKLLIPFSNKAILPESAPSE